MVAVDRNNTTEVQNLSRSAIFVSVGNENEGDDFTQNNGSQMEKERRVVRLGKVNWAMLVLPNEAL